MVFMGMMLSAPFWGNFSDKYGRKMGLLIAAWLLFYYGILSSTAPTYIWLILLRSLVGFAIGCIPQS
jgi:MFS family permease